MGNELDSLTVEAVVISGITILLDKLGEEELKRVSSWVDNYMSYLRRNFEKNKKEVTQ